MYPEFFQFHIELQINFHRMKNISVQTLKWAAIKCHQAELITPSVIYMVMSPP